jgi:hypothetical protein
MLAEIGKRLGRKALAPVASVTRPDTTLAWYRKLIAHKFDGSQYRRSPGRPPIEPKLEALIEQMAKRIPVGGTTGLWARRPISVTESQISDRPSAHGLKRHGIAPAPKRSQTMTWKEFIQSHMAVLATLAWQGTRHREQAWMQQMARLASKSPEAEYAAARASAGY